jgi:hypothetical protein
MKPPAIGSYRDADGACHELVVRETADGGWRVLDLEVEESTASVIETLAGGEDGRPQAEAIARDYLTTVSNNTASAGRLAGDPISEQGEADGSNHRRTRSGPCRGEARGAALPRAAR